MTSIVRPRLSPIIIDVDPEPREHRRCRCQAGGDITEKRPHDATATGACPSFAKHALFWKNRPRVKSDAWHNEVENPQRHWHWSRLTRRGPRHEFAPPSPPAHLGRPEQQIWRDVFSDFSLTARISGAVLATALEAHQRAREARETIASEGMIVGRAGQGKVHPLLAVERDARQAWLSAIKALGLEL